MLCVKSQSRRRTPGGVYIQLLKADSRMTPDKARTVFGDEQRKFREDSKKKLKEKYVHVSLLSANVKQSACECCSGLVTRLATWLGCNQ